MTRFLVAGLVLGAIYLGIWVLVLKNPFLEGLGIFILIGLIIFARMKWKSRKN